MRFNGVNTATNTKQVAHCVKNHGARVIGRYYTGANAWKRLTAGELCQLARLGLRVLSLWQESANHEEYFTHQRGLRDGRQAATMGTQLGQPPGTPIYFAVDYDAIPSHRPHIITYLAAVHQSLHQYACQSHVKPYTLGVYGSRWVLDWCQTWGKTSHFMQAHPPGWSGGHNARPWPGYHVRQLSSNRPLCDILIDHLDVRTAAGSWLPAHIIARP